MSAERKTNMEVTYIDHMGTDLSVVNAARVSFGKKTEWEENPVWGINNETGEPYWISFGKVSDRDKGLIQFLARGCTSGDWDDLVEKITMKGIQQAYDDFALNPVTEDECEKLDHELREILNQVKNMPTHWTPFGHTAITLHIKAPIFVARQLGKHQVGFVWNEVSRRYVDDIPECYEPTYWRPSAESVKQGSVDTPIGSNPAQISDYGKHIRSSVELYCDMINDGVCPEQARMVLPQSMYTEWYWTGNLYAFANVFVQRTDSHAQREVQDVAHQIGEIIKPLF